MSTRGFEKTFQNTKTIDWCSYLHSVLVFGQDETLTFGNMSNSVFVLYMTNSQTEMNSKIDIGVMQTSRVFLWEQAEIKKMHSTSM